MPYSQAPLYFAFDICLDGADLLAVAVKDSECCCCCCLVTAKSAVAAVEAAVASADHQDGLAESAVMMKLVRSSWGTQR